MILRTVDNLIARDRVAIPATDKGIRVADVVWAVARIEVFLDGYRLHLAREWEPGVSPISIDVRKDDLIQVIP